MSIAILALIPKRDVCQVNKKKRIGRYFKVTTEIIRYEMDGFILDLGSYVNMLPNKSWELMGRPNLV